jgi:translation initiation factor 5
MINIGGDASDAHARHQMAPMQLKIEGAGINRRTVIMNAADICRSLYVSPVYTAKFFALELGAGRTSYDDQRRVIIIKGEHSRDLLAEALDKFINLYIVCPRCRNPFFMPTKTQREIKYKTSKGRVETTCTSCGHSEDFTDVHRLSKYILTEATKARDAKKKDRKSKKSKKGDAADEKEVEEPAEGGEAPVAAAAQPTATAALPDDSEVEWFTDSSRAASEKRLEEERKAMEAVGLAGPEKKKKKTKDKKKRKDKNTNPVDVLRAFLSESHTTSEIRSELKRLRMAHSKTDIQMTSLILDALLGHLRDAKEIPGVIAERKDLLSMLTGSSEDVDHFFAAFEQFVSTSDLMLISRFPIFLQALYDADVLEEEAILAWAKRPPESAILAPAEDVEDMQKAAKPFIEWLENADESEEDDDEEDDDE